MVFKPGSSALDYIRHGFAPVPVPAGQKGPVFDGWQHLRIAEVEADKYFPEGSNVGLLCGEASGDLIDVDLDCDFAIAAAGVLAPDTGMAHGRGARTWSHLWYVSQGCKTKKFKDILDICTTINPKTGKPETMLVEVRSDGLQTIVPPSVHPDGDEYGWNAWGDASEIPPAQLHRAGAQIATVAVLARRWPAKGSRHEAHLALSGLLLNAGVALEEAQSIVEATAIATGSDTVALHVRTVKDTWEKIVAGENVTGGTTLSELLRGDGPAAVQRVCEFLGLRAAEEPWPEPIPFTDWTEGLPPFPTDALPVAVRAMVRAVAEFTQTPEDHGAMIALSVIASVVQDRLQVEPTPGYIEPLSLWAVGVAPSGERKSAVVSHYTRPLYEIFKEEAELMAEEINVATIDRDIIQRRLDSAMREAASSKMEDHKRQEARELATVLKADLEATSIPRPRRYVFDDVTPESLSMLMSAYNGSAGVLGAEAGLFGLFKGRYADNGGPNFEIFLKSHAAEPVSVHRVTRDEVVLDRPVLSLGLLVQPNAVRELIAAPMVRGRGLLARFMFAWPKSRVGYRKIDVAGVPDSVREDWQDVLLGLHRLDHTLTTIRFSDEAHAAHKAFRGVLEGRMRPDEGLEHLTDWGSKLGGAVARIAGLIHAVEHLGEGEVSKEAFDRAVVIANYLEVHACAVMLELSGDEIHNRAQALLGYLRRKGIREFAGRDVQRSLRKTYPTSASLRPVLERLTDMGYLRLAKSSKGKGRPKMLYKVFHVTGTE